MDALNNDDKSAALLMSKAAQGQDTLQQQINTLTAKPSENNYCQDRPKLEAARIDKTFELLEMLWKHLEAVGGFDTVDAGQGLNSQHTT